MKTYYQRSDGWIYDPETGRWIPPDEKNSDYQRVQMEVSVGKAQMLPYEEPEKPTEQLRLKAYLGQITHDQLIEMLSDLIEANTISLVQPQSVLDFLSTVAAIKKQHP